MAFEGNSLDRSLKCVSDVMRFITERNRKVQTRGYEWGYTERERLRSVRQILLHSPEGEFSETDEKRLDIAKKLYTDMSELVLSAELTRGDTETEFSPYIYGLTIPVITITVRRSARRIVCRIFFRRVCQMQMTVRRLSRHILQVRI